MRTGRDDDRAALTTVLLVDDQEIVRAGFRVLLELTDDLVVVGEAADGREALGLAQALQPDVVLMDVRMPVMDGIAATRAITSDPALADMAVVVLTTFEVDEHVFGAIRAGAAGFLLKDLDAEGLQDAVRTVAAGHGLIDPAVTRRVMEEFATPTTRTTDPERLDVLTERERDVVALVGEGLNNAEIAGRLCMSPLTAKTHVSRAMTKLHCRDRVQLVIVAYETGLVG